FFMGEYASMLAVCGIASTLWFGGWLPPVNVVPFTLVPGFIWFLIKLFVFFFGYVWLRATLPRLRYDALMNLGWKRMLPTAIVILFVVAAIDTYRTADAPVPTRRGGGARGAAVVGPTGRVAQ